jgi:hypothetical protein
MNLTSSPCAPRLLPLVVISVLLGWFTLAGVAQAATSTVRVEDAGFTTDRNAIQQLLPGFGSAGPVTLNWDPLATASTALLNWRGSYSGRDAAYCASGINCALDLNVAPGFFVTLDSFRLGGWPNTDRAISWSVLDLSDSSIVAAGAGTPVSGATGLVLDIGATSATGFRVLFGPDGFNGGINDIVYSSAPIPEPGTWALMLGGLAGVVGWARRRGRRAA